MVLHRAQLLLVACLVHPVVHSGTISLTFGPCCRHARVWPQSQPLDCSCTSFFFTDFVVPPQASHFDLCFRLLPHVDHPFRTIRTAPPARFHRGTLNLANPWRDNGDSVALALPVNTGQAPTVTISTVIVVPRTSMLSRDLPVQLLLTRFEFGLGQPFC